jgi:hypothetical protein
MIMLLVPLLFHKAGDMNNTSIKMIEELSTHLLFTQHHNANLTLNNDFANAQLAVAAFSLFYVATFPLLIPHLCALPNGPSHSI